MPVAIPRERSFARTSRGDGLVGPFGAECARSRLLVPVAPSCGVGLGGFSAGCRYELGEESLAQLQAYPHNLIEWNGHHRVALSGLCFESKGRGRC